jgi:ribosome recycling factor
MTTAQDIQRQAEDKMKKAVAATQEEMGTIRTGRANPMILERISVDYYGTGTPLRQMANVSVQDGNTLVIQPYDKTQIAAMKKAISTSDLGLTPTDDGSVIRLTIPPLSEERRKEMVKLAKKFAEEGKVAVRNVRREATDDVDKLKKADNLPEDAVKDYKDKIQKLTDRYTAEMDKLLAAKEKELLEV